jgi:hypothetical protein
MNKKNILSLTRNAGISLLLLLAVSGCRPSMLYWTAPEGPAEYQLGWQDGCDTGISAEGGYLKQALYGFKKRPEMGENDQYKQGWNEGFTYCRFVEATQNKSD